MTKFVQLTRVYKSGSVVKKQPIKVEVSSIESFRPRNKFDGQRTTLVTKSGMYLNVAEKFSDVTRIMQG